ncbi:MAG: DUF2076 domain-containing protein [Devosia sp.]|nr:DUF2076 domain-containing protein [Devosia sp.]
MTPEDRRAIEGLFDRLAEAERRAPARDDEAEALIGSEMRRLPHAAYYMAQTIVVQQQALEAAERKITELEAESAQRGGDRQMPRSRGPWDRAGDGTDPRYQRGGMGGGFLAGAMQTALGVAGGVLLGSAIGSLFGAGGAHAAEAPADDGQGPADQNDQGNDAGNESDFGGDDFGDGGGFDMGGDF